MFRKAEEEHLPIYPDHASTVCLWFSVVLIKLLTTVGYQCSKQILASKFSKTCTHYLHATTEFDVSNEGPLQRIPPLRGFA